MRKTAITILVAFTAICTVAPAVQAQPATIDDALVVAENWIDLIIQEKGSWGGAQAAQVQEVQEIMRNGRTLGYFCRVEPKGYIVVSLRRELAPVKVYSAVCDLDPTAEVGMADLIKDSLERLLDRIEQETAKQQAPAPGGIVEILEIDYRDTWDALLAGVPAAPAPAPQEPDGAGGEGANYQEGQVLLTTAWHQGPPYNDDCPWMNCGNSNGRALVGCVATAGAQIMRYWYWPPYGVGSPYNDTYDWPNMPDTATTGSPQAVIDAVAELCAEVGQAVGMSYGCGSSTAYTYDMEGVYEDHYRYSTICAKRDRPDYTASEWFDRIKAQINVNRPVQYRIPGHSIVGDGWQEVGVPAVKQYHMNYGWGGPSNAWYTLDALQGGDPNEEYMLEGIKPAQALGSWLSGTYTLQAFPYRYFDRDATGSSATFNSGQYLQFLPGVTVTCTSTTGGSITFYGWSRLFTRGDTSQGIRIYSGGAIKLYQNGSIRLH